MSKKMDKILLLSTIIISIFGLLMIYSASSIWSEYKFNDSFYYVKHQTLFFLIGLILMFIISIEIIIYLRNNKH